VVDFSTGDGFLLCPFVETRDVRYWHIADIRGTATICPLLECRLNRSTQHRR
jgi:hypothetical protein